MNKNVFLVEGVHPQAKKKFEANEFRVQTFSSSFGEEELLNKGEFSILGIRSRTFLKESFFNKAQDIIAVGAFCIGTNQIDLKSASLNGVAVFNSPYSNTRSVAELTLANIVNLSRKITHLNQLAHSGRWEKTARSSFEVRGKTLGIVGYGHIGSQVGILAEALGMKVFYYDIKKKLSLGNACPAESFKNLLSVSDFLTLHVPATPQTKNMISEQEFKCMKKGSYLINTSRGSTVCLPSLVKALKEKHLFGAAIDVFPEEPSSNQELFSNELQKMDNVILTPHIGGSTEEAQVGIAQEVSESLVRYLKYGDSTGSVNFPHLSPPPINEDSTYRVSNIHKNVPGVLSEINSLISELNINVSTQRLSTSENIGYLVMDMKLENLDQVQKISVKIQNLKTSIKTRILSPRT